MEPWSGIIATLSSILDKAIKWYYIFLDPIPPPTCHQSLEGFDLTIYLSDNKHKLRWHLPCNICPGDMCQLSRIDVYLISYLSDFDQILKVVLLTPLCLGFSARLKILHVSNCNIELTV